LSSSEALFPLSLSKLNLLIDEIVYKISRLNKTNMRNIRFTWYPAHVGIKSNEMTDQGAKEASVSGDYWENNITYKEILNSLRSDYLEEDN